MIIFILLFITTSLSATIISEESKGLPSLTKKEFLFLRHGQTDWNLEKKVMGQEDIPLNATGIKEAESIRETIIPSLKFDYVCHSPLKRAAQTAELATLGLYCIKIAVDKLKERNIGKCTGMPKEEAFPQGEYDYCLPTGESRLDFFKRITEGCNESLSNPGKVLIVSHGGVYDVLCYFLNIKAQSLSNCQVAHFKPSNCGWNINLINPCGA